jgi:hypothetical protein
MNWVVSLRSLQKGINKIVKKLFALIREMELGLGWVFRRRKIRRKEVNVQKKIR